MKRIIGLTAAAAMALCLAACSASAPQEGFYLDTLPDIGTFSGEKAERWQNRRTDTFIPSAEYGELLPYLGDKKVYESPYTSPQKWDYFGLCTADGTIVLEPVYSYVNDAGEYWFLDGKKDAPPLLVAKDGSAMLEGVAGYTFFDTFADGRILKIDRSRERIEGVTVYGRDMQPRFSVKNATDDHGGAYMVVGNLLMYSEGSYYNRVYDQNGEKLKVGGKDLVGYLGDDTYVVRGVLNRKLGVADGRLQIILDYAYEKVVRVGSCTYAVADGYVEVWDDDFIYLKDFAFTEQEHAYWAAIDADGTPHTETFHGAYFGYVRQSADGQVQYDLLFDEKGNLLEEEPVWETEETLTFLEEDGYYRTVRNGKTIVKIATEGLL